MFSCRRLSQTKFCLMFGCMRTLHTYTVAMVTIDDKRTSIQKNTHTFSTWNVTPLTVLFGKLEITWPQSRVLHDRCILEARATTPLRPRERDFVSGPRGVCDWKADKSLVMSAGLNPLLPGGWRMFVKPTVPSCHGRLGGNRVIVVKNTFLYIHDGGGRHSSQLGANGFSSEMANSCGVLSADNLLIEDGIFFRKKKTNKIRPQIYTASMQARILNERFF